MMNLIVPINLQGLRVSQNDATKITINSDHFSGPTTSYDQLPWRDAKNDHQGRLSMANLGNNINNPLGGNITESLEAGIHLHWALPDGLTHGHHSSGDIDFPALPDRWLVTRLMRSAGKILVKQWIVESDYLMTEEDYRTYTQGHRKSVALPVGWDFVSGTDPEIVGAVYYPPWRRIGKVFELEQWTPQPPDTSGDPTKVRHLDELILSKTNLMAPEAGLGPLKAVGHSGPAFSAYYPDCSSMFGFHDTFADIDKPFELNNAAFEISYSVIGWHSRTKLDPFQDQGFQKTLSQAKQCSATAPNDEALLMATVILDYYGWAYDATKGCPERCMFAGQIIDIPWDTTGNKPDFCDSSTLPKCYLVPPNKDNSVRIAVANSASGALAALLQHELDPNSSDLEFMLDALQLGILNQLGSSYSMAQLEQALNEHGFASRQSGFVWEIKAISDLSATALPDSSGQFVPLLDKELAMDLSRLNNCQQRMDALIAVIRSEQRQLFLDWYSYLEAVFSEGDRANSLRDYLSVQIEDLWIRLEAAFGLKTAARADTRNLPVFFSTPDTYLRHDPVHGLYVTDSPSTSIAGQLVVLANSIVTQLQGKLKGFELKQLSGAQFWEPHDPVIVATGDSLVPAKRNGSLRKLPCRLSTQILSSLSAEVSGTKTSIVGTEIAQKFQTPMSDALSGNTTNEWKETQPLLKDIASLLGEFALLDPGLAESLASSLRVPSLDLRQAMVELTTRIVSAWSVGAESRGDSSLPETLNDTHVTVGSLEVSWSGQAPQGLALNSQTSGWKDPFLPLFLVWSASFNPFEKAEKPDATAYDPEFMTGHFTIDENAVEFNVRESAPALTPGTITLSGSVSLSSRIADPMIDQIVKYRENAGDNADTLIAVVDYLRRKPLLSQCLEGINASVLSLKGGLQLRPFNPFYDAEPSATRLNGNSTNFPSVYQNCPTYFVASSVGKEMSHVPGGALSTYHPVRVGFLDIDTVDVVDVFGRKRRLIDKGDKDKVIAASALKPGVHCTGGKEHHLYLPPRLAQSSRLRFRWLAADSDTVEFNSSVTMSPICGWIVPNHLDNSLALFTGDGEALGSLGVVGNQDNVTWRSPAGHEAKGIEEDLKMANPTLRDFATYINGKGRVFFNALNDAIENAHTYIMPANNQASQALAVLMGRPIAIVKAGLRLELEGLPAFDTGAASLAQAMNDTVNGYDWTSRNIANITKVRFPIRLGDRNHLEDGLIAYMHGDGSFDTIYAPAANQNAIPGVVRPKPDTIVLEPNASIDPPEKNSADKAEKIADMCDCNKTLRQKVVTMLIDPCAKIHAAAGVLPVKAIDLPPEIYIPALRKMAVTFFTHPVLRGNQKLDLPFPDEPGYQWSWTTARLQSDGIAQPESEPLAPYQQGDRANFSYTPQLIEEGWLRLIKEEKQ